MPGTSPRRAGGPGRHHRPGRVALLAGVLVAALGAPAVAHPAPATLPGWLSRRPLLVAHRGGDASWPEASPLAYRRAQWWDPALALELPVRRTADGVWVVSEDATTGRVFGTDLAIAHVPWARLATLRSRQAGQPVTRLVDVLDAAGPAHVLFVDDKAGVAVGALLDLLDAHGGPSRVVVKSYWRTASVPAAARARGYLTWGYYYADQLQQFDATQGRFDLLGLEWSAPPSAWRRLEATGKPVIGHVVATPTQARRALAAGAAGLMVSGVEQVVPPAR